MGSNAIGNRIKRTQNTFLYSVKASIFKGFQREATFYSLIWSKVLRVYYVYSV